MAAKNYTLKSRTDFRETCCIVEERQKKNKDAYKVKTQAHLTLVLLNTALVTLILP